MDDLNAVGSFCPTCGAEYRPGFSVCADDGTDLVPGPRPEPAPEPFIAPSPEPASEVWVRVAEFGNEERARLLAGRLEAEGIVARLDPEWASTHYGPGTSAFLGRPFGVLVPRESVDDALAVIREIEGA